MKNATKIIFGVVAILAGVLYIGDIFEIWNISLRFNGWWTLFIIIPSIGKMISSGINLGNLIALAVGLWLLVQQQHWFDNQVMRKASFAVVLIAVGIVLIFGDFKKKRRLRRCNSESNNYQKTEFSNSNCNSDDNPRYFTAFGGNTIKNVSKNFIGGEAISIFGGMEIDLSETVPNENAIFNVNVMFGGTEIIVPEGVNIITDGLSLFGGCDNLITETQVEERPIFTIKYFTLFGGIDILSK